MAVGKVAPTASMRPKLPLLSDRDGEVDHVPI